MSNQVRIGGLTPQLVQSSPTGGPARVAFSSLVTPSAGAPVSSGGVTGRQVLQAAIGTATSPRSLVKMAAGFVTGGPVGLAAAALDSQAEQMKTLEFLDQVRNYILTNAIFDTCNMPMVESQLNES